MFAHMLEMHAQFTNSEADELRSLVSERDYKLREAQAAYDELEGDRNDVEGSDT